MGKDWNLSICDNAMSSISTGSAKAGLYFKITGPSCAEDILRLGALIMKKIVENPPGAVL